MNTADSFTLGLKPESYKSRDNTLFDFWRCDNDDRIAFNRPKIFNYTKRKCRKWDNSFFLVFRKWSRWKYLMEATLWEVLRTFCCIEKRRFHYQTPNVFIEFVFMNFQNNIAVYNIWLDNKRQYLHYHLFKMMQFRHPQNKPSFIKPLNFQARSPHNLIYSGPP